MASLELSHDELVPLVAFELNYGRRSYGHYTDSQREVIDQVLDSGYRQFLYPPAVGGRPRHRWSFLWPEATLTLSAPYTTGTVAIANGVVTGTGTLFSTNADWAAQGEITPLNGSTYTVDSLDSETQLTLDDTSTAADEDAGTTYSLGRVEYDMPSDFGGFQGDMTYRPGASTVYDPIEFVSWNMIRRLRQLHSGTTTRPRRACLLAKPADPTAVQGWKLVFDYQSDSAYRLFYKYKVNISALDATNKYAVGGPAHSETLLASCLYAAARFLGEDAQKVQQAKEHFLSRLQASIDDDEAMTPETLGRMRDPSEDEYPVGRHLDPGVPAQFEGTTYY